MGNQYAVIFTLLLHIMAGVELMTSLIYAFVIILSTIPIVNGYISTGQTISYCPSKTLPTNGYYTAKISSNSDQDSQLIATVSMGSWSSSNGWSIRASPATVNIWIKQQIQGQQPTLTFTSGSDYLSFGSVELYVGQSILGPLAERITLLSGICGSNNIITPPPTLNIITSAPTEATSNTLPESIAAHGDQISFSATIPTAGLYLVKITISTGQSQLIHVTLGGQLSNHVAVNGGNTYDIYVHDVPVGDTELILTCTSLCVVVSDVQLFRQEDMLVIPLSIGSEPDTTNVPTIAPTKTTIHIQNDQYPFSSPTNAPVYYRSIAVNTAQPTSVPIMFTGMDSSDLTTHSPRLVYSENNGLNTDTMIIIVCVHVVIFSIICCIILIFYYIKKEGGIRKGKYSFDNTPININEESELSDYDINEQIIENEEEIEIELSVVMQEM
eukprot:441800_1